jgi:hypothetical protein
MGGGDERDVKYTHIIILFCVFRERSIMTLYFVAAFIIGIVVGIVGSFLLVDWLIPDPDGDCCDTYPYPPTGN